MWQLTSVARRVNPVRPLVPAKAGTQSQVALHSRFRGNERTRAACAVAFGAVAFLLAGAVAAAEENFYAGRQIAWILSADAGGGYASYARAFAPFFAKHIPGNPGIVIQHMPGAGGIRAMNYLNSVAPKDGTMLGLVHSSVPFAPLFGLKGAKFDPRQMHWIGSIDANTAICIAWHSSRIKTWQDALEREFTVGGSGAGSQMETMPAMLNKLFGAKMKVISGYKGGNEIYLAMERGEVDGRCGGLVSSINSTRPGWFVQKKINVPIVVALARSPLSRRSRGRRIRQGRCQPTNPAAVRGAAGDGPPDPGAARCAARAHRAAARGLSCCHE